MSDNELLSKWNARYAYSGEPVPAPASFLSRGERWLPRSFISAYEVADPVQGASDDLTGARSGDAMASGSRDDSSGAPEAVSGAGGARAHHQSLTALDLACGRAGNAHWLAERGFAVSAWDISSTVVDELERRKPQVLHDIQVRDVLKQPPSPESFDVIVVSRFLERSLCPAIQVALKPEGVLFYETFVTGLSNPDYLLKPNELLQLFSGLHVLEYNEPGVSAFTDEDGNQTAVGSFEGSVTGAQGANQAVKKPPAARSTASLIARRV